MTLTLKSGYVPRTALATALTVAKATNQDVVIQKDSKVLAIVTPTGKVTYLDDTFKKACK